MVPAPAEIGLVWMDTEGYEPHALVGLGEIVRRGVPIAFESSRRATKPRPAAGRVGRGSKVLCGDLPHS
jgi:hypothetical protein